MPVQVLGVGQLVTRMKALPDKLRDKGLRSAMKAAAKPIVQATKALAPVRTGLLRQSIASVVVKGRKDRGWSALIGMRHMANARAATRRGARKFKATKTVLKRVAALGLENADPARYAHLVEFGHNMLGRGRFWTKTGHGASGGRVATITGQSIADMSPDDFAVWLGKPGNQAKFKKLAGG